MIDRLTVMSWGGGWGRALAACVSEPFTRKTGIHVEHVQHVGLALPASLLAALDREHPAPFDVVWSNAVPALRVAERGGCRPLGEVENLGALGARARIHPALAIPYVVHYVLAYATNAFTQPPDSYEVLLDARHRGKIALYPGGNGFHAVAQVLGGGSLATVPDDMGACWAFVRQLAPQLGCLGYSIDMGPRFARGELTLAFRALPNALAFRAEGHPVGWSAPREGVPETLDALWIPRSRPDEAARCAAQYIDFALSREVQERWCRELGAMPTRRDAAVAAPFGTCGLPATIDDAGGLALDDRIKLLHEPDWERAFDAICGAHGAS